MLWNLCINLNHRLG